jgi:hypothetical protein
MGLKRYGGPPSAVELADSPGADLPQACLVCDGCSDPSHTGLAAASGVTAVRVKGPGMDQVRQVVMEEVLAALKGGA